MRLPFLSPVLFLFSQIALDEVGAAQAKNVAANISSVTVFAKTSGNSVAQTLDSIAAAGGVAKSFAAIYASTTRAINIKAATMSQSSQTFIRKFETAFADLFLRAYYQYQDGQLDPTSEWSFFFSHPGVRSWQLTAFGVNVHINADLWRALVSSASEIEIRRNKRQFLSLQSAVAKVYRSFFEDMIAQNSHIRFVNQVTKGMVGTIGEKLVYKWRRRNLNLALAYYHNPTKFKRRLAAAEKKKHRLDELFLRK